MAIFHALINNLTLLVSLGVLYSLILRKFPRNPTLHDVLSGVLFGAIALFAMFTPLRLHEGAIYDGRSIVLALAGLFGGPVAGLIAAPIAAAGRFWIGGVGQWVGVAVIVEATLLGLAWHYLARRWPRLMGWPYLWAFGVVVHLGMLALQLGLPADLRWQVVRQIAAPVLLLYPSVLMLIAWIFGQQRSTAAVFTRLAEHERLLQDILDAMPNPVYYKARDGTYLTCNRAFAYYAGQRRQDMIGRTMDGLLPPPVAAAIAQKDQEMFENPGVQHFDVSIPCADGVTREVAFDRAALRNPDGSIAGIVACASDLTPHRKLEDQLRQAAKLEAVGRLAGGVAHDFNNMLSVILGQTEELLDSIGERDGRRAELEEIRRAALRSTELTRQLLSFARRQTVNPQPIELGAQIRESLRMLRRLIPESVRIDFAAPREPLVVLLDPAQFDQALTNLVLNARDAIEKSGQVRISLEEANLTEPHPGAPASVPAGDWVRVRVEDTGVGIPPGLIDKIFEPFFTTKDLGKGTGLGLATVYGIVSQGHGHVQVRSHVGQGTTFDLYFPRHEGPSMAHGAPRPRRPTAELLAELRETVPAPGHTVLVVEDEESNLRLIERLLTRAGYQVLAANSPLRALELFEAHGEEIAMLLTDVIMPEMNGLELFLALRERKPGIECVFMSGYTADILSSQGLDETETRFLAKPFSRDELLRAVHEASPPGGRRPLSGP